MSFREFIDQHPYIAAWIALAIGMVAILLWSSRNVDLLFQQRLALVITTILLAGACVWIISWEEDQEEGGDSSSLHSPE